jgi:hypothetical protein
MTEPVRPKILSTGTDTAAGVIHVATHPDIERTSPFAPRVRPTVFPIRTRPFAKVKRSENSPVVLL